MDFELYCIKNDIITLYIFPYSSHLLQLFDFKCFGLLKKTYGREIEDLIWTRVLYITKAEFFLIF